MVFVFIPSITLGRFIFLAFSSILEQLLLRLDTHHASTIQQSNTWQLNPNLRYWHPLLILLQQITDQGKSRRLM